MRKRKFLIIKGILFFWFLAAPMMFHYLRAEDYLISNVLDLKLVHVPSGRYSQGKVNGDETPLIYSYDELPARNVVIDYDLYVSEKKITVKQYRLFDSNFKYQFEDGESVSYVSWEDANRFCDWLSKKEGKNYRLLSESEWEYISRAGSNYEIYPKLGFSRFYGGTGSVNDKFDIQYLNLLNGKNLFGVYGLHAGLEEWTSTTYKPYFADSAQYQSIKVVRGGLGNHMYEFRHSHRRAAFKGERQSNIGFRVAYSTILDDVVIADKIKASDNEKKSDSQSNRIVEYFENQFSSFTGPIPFVKNIILKGYPQFSHQHQPTAVMLDGGDILAAWYATVEEDGREMIILYSRFEKNKNNWSNPSILLAVKDRNQTGASFYYDKKKKRLYFATGVSLGEGYRQNLAGYLLTSDDEGRTWAEPVKVVDRGDANNIFQPINGMFENALGALVVPSDNPLRSNDGDTTLWVGDKSGKGWKNSEKSIMGIHAAVAKIDDDRLIAVGRRKGAFNTSNLPITKSDIALSNPELTFSIFPNIGGGQRASLIKTSARNLILASFTNRGTHNKNTFLFDSNSGSYRGLGLFVALSADNGKSWPWFRLLTNLERNESLSFDGGAHVGSFLMTHEASEPGGYTVLLQGDDKMIHLLTSRLHYRFTEDWIKVIPD